MKRMRNERGASLVEYALLIALIAVVIIAALTALGKRSSTDGANLAFRAESEVYQLSSKNFSDVIIRGYDEDRHTINVSFKNVSQRCTSAVVLEYSDDNDVRVIFRHAGSDAHYTSLRNLLTC